LVVRESSPQFERSADVGRPSRAYPRPRETAAIAAFRAVAKRRGGR